MSDQPGKRRGRFGRISWSDIVDGTRLNTAVNTVQFGAGLALLILSAIVLVRTFIDFIDAPGGYPQTLVAAIDGVLVVIILIDILRTVVMHVEGAGFPFRPFLVIGIIAAVREILAVSTRLTLSSSSASPQALLQLGISAAVVVLLAFSLWLTRDVRMAEADAANG